MIHFIAKPPKRRREKKLIDTIEQRLNEEGVAYTLHYTKEAGDGCKIASELTAAGETELVVIGGDGSLNNVLSGIENPAECMLGLIPAGTGNDFAAVAKIPKGIKALDLILHSEAKPCDYLQFSDGRRSFNIAGLGIDVDILERCYRMKHFHAKTKYFLSLLASLVKYRGTEILLKTERGEERRKIMIAAICNGTQFGGGIEICPPAQIDDGLLDLVIIDFPKRRKIPFALVKLVRGKVLSLKFAEHLKMKEVTVTPLTPCTAQYDGELFNTEQMQATLVTGQLKLYRG